MSPPNPSNGDANDAFAFLKILRDQPGPFSSRFPTLPGLEDSDDDFDDLEKIPGESPNTSQSTTPGRSQEGDEDLGDEDDEFDRERRRGAVEDGEGEEGRQEGQAGHEYELRRNINRETFQGSGYTDHDETGTYDPGEESEEEGDMRRRGWGRRGRKRLSERRRDRKGKGKTRRGGDVGEDGDGEEDDGRDAEDGREDDVAAMDGLDLNGPSQSQEAGDDEDEDEDDDLSIDDVAANTSDIDPDEARLRKTAKKKMPRKPTGPPQPQSCVTCKNLHLECSLHDSPSSYPCTHCTDSESSCLLLVPYTDEQREGSRIARKKEKSADRKARKVRKKMDEQILRHQQKKVADLKALHEREKRLKACTHCKENKAKCSNEDLDWGEVRYQTCKRCFKHGKVCQPSTLRAVREPEEEGRPRGQRPLPTFGSPAFDRDDEEEVDAIHNVAPDGEAPKKRTRKFRRKGSKLSGEVAQDEMPEKVYVCAPGYAKKQITTNFCHPLVFNAPMRADDEECMGCDVHVVAFSIFGFPVAKPWVTFPDPYPSPATMAQTFAYHEIPGTGGHTESTDHRKTNICKTCTFARQKILFCPGHQLAGIRNLPKPRDFDFDGAYAPLLSDQEVGFRTNTAVVTKWCSICPAPAFVECVSHGPLAVAGEKPGCGLFVCEICAVAMLTPSTTDPVGVAEKEALATKEVQTLLRDVKKVNISARQALLNPGAPIPERQFVPVRRKLEDVIEEAKTMCEDGGGKGGKYLDGVRADVELVSRRGWLAEWMEHEAERRRQLEWAGSGVMAAGRGRSAGRVTRA